MYIKTWSIVLCVQTHICHVVNEKPILFYVPLIMGLDFHVPYIIMYTVTAEKLKKQIKDRYDMTKPLAPTGESNS